jgi:hypothetical protein
MVIKILQEFTERDVQILWFEQKQLSKNLYTSQNQSIEVICPGIWNQQAGPDFLKAHLRIGSVEYRGDIEIHIEERGWYQHQHHQDKLYNHVILHIVYRKTKRPISIYREDGQQPFTCYLEPHLQYPLQQRDLLPADYYPFRQFIGKGQCAIEVFQKLSDKAIQKFFQSASYWRLERKLNYLEQNVSERHLQFITGIAMSLGYKQNAIAFLDLFQYLWKYRDLPYEQLLAISLGCCGFLEINRKESWEGSSYYHTLRSLWWEKQEQITHQTCLHLHGIRPLHHPIRRLVYLTHLLQDSTLEKRWGMIIQIWEKVIVDFSKNIPLEKSFTKKLTQQIFEVIPHYSHSYWNYHFTFEKTAQVNSLPILGDDIKMHILLNTILPLLNAAFKPSVNAFYGQFFQFFYASLKTTLTGKSRYLHQRFLGENKEQNFFQSSQLSQGAYQLHQDFCLHFESSCRGCPFVERYTQQNETEQICLQNVKEGLISTKN